MYVSEQVEAKVDFIFSHGRGEPDQDEDVSITDRRYKRGTGNMGCMYIKKLVDAINRSEYARDQLKIAYFVDNAPFHLASTNHFGQAKSWGDPEYQDFVWNYAVKKFYETVPEDMLFRMSDGSVPMQWWSANANYDYNTLDNNILGFFEYISEKMLETFGLEVSYILDGTFFSRDPRTRELAKGQQAWFTWCGAVTSMVEFKDRFYAFALNGGRMPITNCRLADWNPITNEGTELRSDCHQPALLSDGSEVIRPVFEEGFEKNAEWLVMESWWDWREGSTWYRSDHPEYAYPNQYISLTREFADRTSSSIVLEAEGCDEYHSLTKGNSGGAYRLNWYDDLDKDFWHSNKECNLNIYRPLHKLSELKEGGENNAFTSISAGLHDVWGVTNFGILFGQEVDGYPIDWQQVTPQLRVKDISVGGYNAWAVDLFGQVKRTVLQTNKKAYECNNWQDVDTEATGRISQVSLNMKEAFVRNEQGKIFYRDLSAKHPWQELPGTGFTSITADDQFVWAILEDGQFAVMSTESRLKWDTIPNPHGLTQIDGSAGEVWGINPQYEVYRINASGHGKWEKVNEGFTYVTVGYEFVWLTGADGKLYFYNITGFEPRSAFVRDGKDPLNIPSPETIEYLSVKASPNPFKDHLTLDINTAISGQMQYTLSDLKGTLITSGFYILTEGSNQIRIDIMPETPPGIYILSVTTEKQNKIVKVIKIN